MPFSVSKRFTLRAFSGSLEMVSEVTNDSSVELPIMWGQHLVFGAPAFGPGSTIEFPPGTSYFAHQDSQFPSGRRSNGESGEWPEMVGPESQNIDMGIFPEKETPTDLHYLTPTEGWYVVRSKDKPLSVAVNWDIATQPYVWFWQQFGAWKEYPWWGTEYLVGLEPWTSAPGSGLGDSKALANSPRIAAGESLTARTVITLNEEKK
jgi:galactose mutarotase-like enzyme